MVGISFNHPLVINSEVFILDHKNNWITVDGPVMIASMTDLPERRREEFKNKVLSTFDDCLNRAK